MPPRPRYDAPLGVPLPIVQRLNGDATWWLGLPGGAVVFDPWLVGSEVDWAPWFHEAWHVDPVVPPHDVPPHDAVVVSQAYADHLHPATLAAWAEAPVRVAVPDAAAAVQRSTPGQLVQTLPAWGDAPLVVGGLRLWRLTRRWWQLPRYHAVVVVGADDRAVLHAPHGLTPEDAADVAAVHPIALLATTRVSYTLPVFLGGRVNPGPEAADAVWAACGRPPALAIHDEAKREAGLVPHVASIRENHPPRLGSRPLTGSRAAHPPDRAWPESASTLLPGRIIPRVKELLCDDSNIAH